MHHLCFLSPITPLSTKCCFLFNPNNYYYSTFDFNGIIRTTRRRSNKYQWWISSMDNRESSNYEVDSDKAKQALSELDQQFESISLKQANSPRIKGSSIGSLKEQERNEPPDITGSFLGYTTFVLFLFSIFYNILFLTVIKPSIDGPDEDIVATDVTTNYQAPDNVSQL
ncbi:putative transcription-associated protein 1 [Bienertia sinuspersici]